MSFSPTEEDVRVIGPLDLNYEHPYAKELTIKMHPKHYTGLRKACVRLKRHAREAGIEIGRELTPESLLKVIVYWYVTTDGEPDIIGGLFGG